MTDTDDRHMGFGTIDELCACMKTRMSELDDMQHAGDMAAYEECTEVFIELLERTFDTLDRQPQGGVTGFQANWIVRMFLLRMLYSNNRCGVCILDLDDMLYPQNREMFTTISSKTWATLQEMALEKYRTHPGAHPDVMAHWRAIVDGRVPFGMVVRE